MNLVTIVEIAVVDFSRAKQFYERVLNVSIEEMPMGEATMGIFPADADRVNVALVKTEGSIPSSEGTVVYFNAGENLQPTLDRVVREGGTVLVPKTEISPEMGYFAQFVDVEGNRIGLHSIG